MQIVFSGHPERDITVINHLWGPPRPFHNIQGGVLSKYEVLTPPRRRLRPEKVPPEAQRCSNGCFSGLPGVKSRDLWPMTEYQSFHTIGGGGLSHLEHI